ncbi:MAG: PDZ domain-containing protein [Deltaproteobacteria bacterium]|nr:PDZ domain-containing protein [Deltaproteobacteria bacterium]
MTKNIYTILYILAIGAIIFTGVDTFYTVIETKLEQPAFENIPVSKKTVQPKRSRAKRLSDYEIINQRSIFGKVANDQNAAEAPPDLDNIEPTSLNISLIATSVVEDDEEYSVAVISVKSKRPPEGMYHIGDSVEGALIKNIFRNKVVLRVNGKDQILEKDEEQTRTGSGPSPPIREPEPMTTASAVSRPIDLQREEVEEALSDLQNLLTQASIKPHFTDGEPDGLAITGVKTGSIFRKMGLRSGDIVKSVQGKDIRSPEDLISLYNDLQSEEEVSVQIIRRGQERTNVLKFR